MNTDSHRSVRTEPIKSFSILSASIHVHLSLILIVSCCTAGLGQSPVRDYRRAHERQILAEFTRLLSIPNIASDATNVRRSAQFIVDMISGGD